MSTLPRVAVVGAGLIGARHAQWLDSGSGASLAAICDPSETARALSRQMDVPHCAALDAMLARDDVDAAVLATPTGLHAEQAVACLRRGWPVLVEKPVSHDVESAARVAAASADTGVPVLVGHHRRHSAPVRAARALLADGALGRLVNLVGQWSVAKPGAYFAPDWRRQAGGGPVLINLIHEIDSLRYLCGDIVRVYAETSHDARGFEVEDSVALTLTFASGARGAIVASDATPSPWTWEQGTGETPAFPRSGCNSYRFMGTEAALEFPNLVLWRQPLEHGWNHPVERERLAVETSDAFAAQLEHFVAVVRGEAAPLVDANDGARTLAATLAVLASARSGRPEAPASVHPGI